MSLTGAYEHGARRRDFQKHLARYLVDEGHITGIWKSKGSSGQLEGIEDGGVSQMTRGRGRVDARAVEIRPLVMNNIRWRIAGQFVKDGAAEEMVPNKSIYGAQA